MLRRAAKSGAKLPRGWLARQETTLAEWLDALTLRIVDRGIVERLAIESALGGCRTLDALHLATALELRDQLGPELVLCTLDAEQASLAATLGLRVEAELGRQCPARVAVDPPVLPLAGGSSTAHFRRNARAGGPPRGRGRLPP